MLFAIAWGEDAGAKPAETPQPAYLRAESYLVFVIVWREDVGASPLKSEPSYRTPTPANAFWIRRFSAVGVKP